MTKLSPTMLAVLALEASAGGLKRLPGGFWVGADVEAFDPRAMPWYTVQTVRALVDRGALEFTAYACGLGTARFPVAARRPGFASQSA